MRRQSFDYRSERNYFSNGSSDIASITMLFVFAFLVALGIVPLLFIAFLARLDERMRRGRRV